MCINSLPSFAAVSGAAKLSDEQCHIMHVVSDTTAMIVERLLYLSLYVEPGVSRGIVARSSDHRGFLDAELHATIYLLDEVAFDRRDVGVHRDKLGKVTELYDRPEKMERVFHV